MGDTPEHPDSRKESAQRAPEEAAGPASDQKQRFNPFVNEDDMFKVVLWAGAICLAIVLLAMIVRSIS